MKIWDADVSGFGVRIRPGGHRGYILQYRFGGRTRRYQIGAHGSPWTVETARDRARVLVGQIVGGEDPLDIKIASRKELTIAQLCDLGKDCGAEANAAKYLGAEASFHACETAILTHGGMGYAKEYDVERYFRESMIARLAPVSREMILNFIAERVLGLPKSY